MKVFNEIEKITELPTSIALTIGVFDGVHLGHQEIFKKLRKLAGQEGTACVLTFENHPSELLTPNSPILPLITLDHKLDLFKKYGIDIVIVLPFTKELSTESYDTFIKRVHSHLHFSALILGEGATLGKNREGNDHTVPALGKTLGFTVDYIKKEIYHKEPISSGRIRALVKEGNLKKIKKMLGRHYSIFVPFHSIEIEREDETLYKWRTKCQGLIPLPPAVYGVSLETNSSSFPGIAFYHTSQESFGNTHIDITLFFESLIPHSPHLNISFMEYLHPEIDNNTLQKISSSLLESLAIQPLPI